MDKIDNVCSLNLAECVSRAGQEAGRTGARGLSCDVSTRVGGAMTYANGRAN